MTGDETRHLHVGDRVALQDAVSGELYPGEVRGVGPTYFSVRFDGTSKETRCSRFRHGSARALRIHFTAP